MLPGPEVAPTMTLVNGNGWKAVGVNVIDPDLVITGVKPTAASGPVMVMVVPETVALYPFSVIFAATLEASVFRLLEELEVPLMICTPFTLMLLTLELELPLTVMVASGPVLSGRLHSL